jgi:hypothetical protein
MKRSRKNGNKHRRHQQKMERRRKRLIKKRKRTKVTISLKVNKKDSSRVPNHWSLGEGSLNRKPLEKSEPSSPPANPASPTIKVENDDGSHNRFLENIMEAAHVKKKQKTEEAGIGSWVAVESLEEGTDSPASRKEPEAHDKAASGKFTFGKATGW